MRRDCIIFLDTGVLVDLCSSDKATCASNALREALEATAAKVDGDIDIKVPEVVMYEARRLFWKYLLPRAKKKGTPHEELARKQIQTLDEFERRFGVEKVTESDWRRASFVWAKIRSRGLATTGDERLDCDAILMGMCSNRRSKHVVLLSTQKKHFGDWCDHRVYQRP